MFGKYPVKNIFLLLLPYPFMLPALEIIPERRRKLGLTQSQLAELAGVSQSYIAKLEAGNIEPSYVKVKALFEALDRLEQEKQISVGQIMNRSVVGIQKDDLHFGRHRCDEEEWLQPAPGHGW